MLFLPEKGACLFYGAWPNLTRQPNHPGIDDPKALTTLLRLFPAEEMVAFPVSSRVGKVGESDAGVDRAGGSNGWLTHHLFSLPCSLPMPW
jgi:hypothetical protein